MMYSCKMIDWHPDSGVHSRSLWHVTCVRCSIIKLNVLVHIALVLWPTGSLFEGSDRGLNDFKSFMKHWPEVFFLPTGGRFFGIQCKQYNVRFKVIKKEHNKHRAVETCNQRNGTITLTNILGPGMNFPYGFTGVQKLLIDLRSRENSRVNSFFHMDWMFWLQAVPCSFFDIPLLLTFRTFIFSQRTVRAVSVASPTFS